MSVAVIGAGLAGLAAAYELRRAGTAVLLLDAERRPGGVIVTDRPSGGWVVEGGPDGFLGSDRDVPALAAELGVADRIIGQQTQGSLVWDGRHLERLSTGAAAGLLEIDARGLDLSAGFATFAAGMSELVAALAAPAPPKFAGITSIAPAAGGWRLSVNGAASVECRGVILAVPAYAAAPLAAALDEPARRALESVRYHPSVNVSLAYRGAQIAHPLDAAGFAAAPGATGPVRACTFASSKFVRRAPRDHVLLRAFLSPDERDPAVAAHATLTPILGITGEPLWVREFEWRRGIPRYAADHGERVAEARRRLGRAGPIALAGAGYDGAGVSACVRSGRAAARELLGRL
jgi:oxygen-dependent protoporphyrinogen oxidase